jgi:phosphatidylglycerol---prolipoprotein diacylglyceryl transferase
VRQNNINMQTLLAYINWNASPDIISIGFLTLKWYGLFFASGFLLGLFMVKRMFAVENAPEEWLDKAFIYIVLGAVLGARFGHVFFYDWDYYSQHLSEIPMIWRGGLASHGGAIGVLIALWLFSRNVSRQSMLWILDKVVVPTALAAAFIRMGNMMNSEILGKPADVAWAFVFLKVDDVPRHPVQLYESITYLISFAVLYQVYWKTDFRFYPGKIFGLFLIFIFGSRILWEQFKDSLGGFEESLGLLSTGQWLSIPFVLTGLYFVFRNTEKVGYKFKKTNKS